jgi:hypothetical protein
VHAAAWYRFGSWGSNDCPTNSTRIVDPSACQSAAAATGKSWGGNASVLASKSCPKGCYASYSYVTNFSRVFFNNNEPNSDIPDYLEPLCFAGAPVSGLDSISMLQESGSTWRWSCSAQCNSTGGSRCSIKAAGLRLIGPLTPLIGRLHCRNEIAEM